MNAHLDLDPARLVAVPLERGEELDVFDGLDLPAGGEQLGGLGEGLRAHHTGQDGCAIDAVVVQEGLDRRVQVGHHDKAVVTIARRRDLPDHRAGAGTGRRRLPARSRSTTSVTRRPRAPATTISPPVTAGGDLLADDRNADRRRQHVDAGQRHHLRDRASAGHADVGPGGPVDGDAAGLGPVSNASTTRSCTAGRWPRCSRSGRRCRSGRRSS